MSRIDEMIHELAPAGVQYSRVDEVAVLKRGTAITKKNVVDGPVPVIAGGRAPAYFHNESNRAGETVAIAGSGAYAGFVSYWSKPIYVSDAFTVIPKDDRVNARYLYFWFQSQQELLHSFKSGGGVPHVYPRSVSGMRMPVPHLEVQLEIVRVLDKFTQLEAELEAELKARRAQYDYYAGQLLTIDEGVRRVRFGDVATIVRGASPRPIQKFITSDPEGLPWIKIGDVPADGKYITSTAQRVTIEGAAKSRRVLPGDFVLSNSMSFGRPYVSQIEGYIHDGWLAISAFEDSFERDFLYYLLRSTPVQEEFVRRAGAGTVKNLNADIVRSVVIPVPPRAEQKRVIDLLDHFDALLNDIRIGLPAELAARRKQYEHYRDRLLTFKETA